MEEYKAIMRLIDTKLDEQQSVIEFYREQQKEWEAQKEELIADVHAVEAKYYETVAENEKLKETVEQLKKEIANF